MWAMHKTMATQLFRMDENTLYRFMNNDRINWRKLLLGFARQFKTIVHRCGDEVKTVAYFIIDDTDLEKTGKTFEFIRRIHNHVRRVWHLGFKMLTLGYWDGKSLIAVDFSLHREKGSHGNYGLTKKERRNQFSKQRDRSTPSMNRIKELDKKKTDVAVSMIKRAVKNGFVASYVLMDSWFTNDYVIKYIRGIKNGALHFLGMCKIDSQKYIWRQTVELPLNNQTQPTQTRKVFTQTQIGVHCHSCRLQRRVRKAVLHPLPQCQKLDTDSNHRPFA